MMEAKKICDKYDKYGTANDLVKCGKSRKTSMRNDRMIIRKVKKNSAISTRAIKENLNFVCIHERTMKIKLKRLSENKLKNYIAKKETFY